MSARHVAAAMVLALAAASRAYSAVPCEADASRAGFAADPHVKPVLEVDSAVERATVMADAAALAPLLGDDFYYVHAGISRKDDKSTWLAALAKATGHYRCRAFIVDHASDLGPAIVLSGVLDVHYDVAAYPDLPEHFHGFLQRIYVKRKHHWQLAIQTAGYAVSPSIPEGVITKYIDSLR